LSRHLSERRSIFVARVAILSALVVIFDYTMKFSGWKIPFPFPPLTFLRFDFTGIPIVLSFLLLGLTPGAATSSVAFIAILVRSGKAVDALMKAMAEFSTVLGMALGLRLKKVGKPASYALGILLRVLVTTLANLVVLPSYQGMPFELTVQLSPLLGAFNVLQGSLSILGGYVIYEALIRRIPSLATRKLTT